MNNRIRVLVFDVALPLLIIGGLVAIGVMLGWPLWWVSLCSMLCLLVAQAVVLNLVGYRRDSVTLGTDDERLIAQGYKRADRIAAELSDRDRRAGMHLIHPATVNIRKAAYLATAKAMLP